MIRIGISGAGGRMGRMIGGLACAAKDLRVTAAVEHAGHPRIGGDFGVLAGAGPIGCRMTSRYEGGADVLIDFSSPEAAGDRIRECAKSRTAYVLGTTGLPPRVAADLRRLARRVPVFQASNMSVGVNVLIRALPEIARALGDAYDVEIVEAHHRFKKDAPSGTALSLAEAIAGGLHRDLKKVAVHGRSGLTGERSSKEIGLHAVRAGDIVGEHRILFGTLGETLEFTHRAHSRELFARGALRAARWLAGRKPGFYGMADLIG